MNGLSYANPSTIEALRPQLGFVAKEDVLDRRLTAREILTLSAEQHMPASSTSDDVSAVVKQTLRILRLDGIADVTVGGSANAAANISGGQLKRVSIGMELVCQPRALILDGESVWSFAV